MTRENLTLTPEVKQWVKEWNEKRVHSYEVKDTLFYQYAGILVDDEYVFDISIYIDEFKVAPYFSCELPLVVKNTIKGLIDDIKKQALTSIVVVHGPFWGYGLDDDERMEISKLPESVMNFWEETGASYEFIIELVALAYNPNIGKFTFINDEFKYCRFYGYWVLTSNYELAKPYFDDMKEWHDDEFYRTYGKRDRAFEWYQLGDLIANGMGKYMFNRYVEETSKE